MENSGKSLRRSSSHLSMTDTDSFHSPRRFDSPLGSDDCRVANDDYNNASNRAIVPGDTFHTPDQSPLEKPNLLASSPAVKGKGWKRWPHSEKPTSENLDLPASQMKLRTENLDFPGKNGRRISLNPPGVTKEEKVRGDIGGVEEGYGGGNSGEDEVGGERRSREAVESILKRSNAKLKVKKVALFFRVFEVIASLISFSVMASDKTQGWSGDSFDRYQEYKYCLFVNIIGFVYSSFQAVDLAYRLVTRNHIISDYLRYYFNFSMDQILAYLLMSASSSAATRVEDWILNWGEDEFTLFASASVAMSFVAFLAFAISAVISGYNLCNRDST